MENIVVGSEVDGWICYQRCQVEGTGNVSASKGSCHDPPLHSTNPYPENKNLKNLKQQSKKKNIPANHPPPLAL